MKQRILITGGTRSGKSDFAVALAAALPSPVTFIATCAPGDDLEMQARVAAHRRQRPPAWNLLEVPLYLSAALENLSGAAIVDCVPTWIANLLLRDPDSDLDAHLAPLLAALARSPADPLILVSAEVGAGLVPETPLGRRFRDAVGLANQQLAAAVPTVVLLVAGLPLPLKSALPSLTTPRVSQ